VHKGKETCQSGILVAAWVLLMMLEIPIVYSIPLKSNTVKSRFFIKHLLWRFAD
jgi:hypothetical protein